MSAVTESSAGTISQRQLRTLKELTRHVFNINNNTDIYRRALESLQDNPQDFPFVVLYEVSDDGKQLTRVGHSPQNLPDALAAPHIDIEADVTERRFGATVLANVLAPLVRQAVLDAQ